jgi:glycosidase
LEYPGRIIKTMQFWLDKGIDGFRMDVINLLAKQQGCLDAENPDRYGRVLAEKSAFNNKDATLIVDLPISLQRKLYS